MSFPYVDVVCVYVAVAFLALFSAPVFFWSLAWEQSAIKMIYGSLWSSELADQLRCVLLVLLGWKEEEDVLSLEVFVVALKGHVC